MVLKSADKAGDELGARAAGSLSRSKLAPYKYPRWIEFRTELPKTATGKIQRFKLRAESGAGEFHLTAIPVQSTTLARAEWAGFASLTTRFGGEEAHDAEKCFRADRP